jgi:hypothetical protein
MIAALLRPLSGLGAFLHWREDWMARTVEAFDGERFCYPED